MVKDDWSVVQCTSCEKINRIPGVQNDLSKQIRINDNQNHFDLYIPYVHVIIICPFCKNENKARKDAEHVVCFKCHNSFSIMKDVKAPSNSASHPNSSFNYPPQKSMRVADHFFPDPMHGYGYMNQFFNPYMFPDSHGMEDYIKKYTKYQVLKDRLKNKKFQPTDPPLINKFNAIQCLLNTVDEIDVNRRKIRDIGTPGEYDKLNHKVIPKYKSGVDYGYKGYGTKNESVYKTMFEVNKSYDKKFTNENEYKNKFNIDDFIMSPKNR